MRLIFTCLLAACMFGATAQQIPNAGFESWVPYNLFISEVPTGWTASGTFPTIVKSTDAYSGNYALKMRVGTYFTGTGANQPGFAFSTPSSTVQPLFYTYWAKVNLASDDKFISDADFTNTGSTLLVTSTAYGPNFLSSSNNTTVWKQFSFPMASSGAGAYDSITLRFYFSPSLDTASYIIVDDLGFSQNPAGITNLQTEGAIENVYPNPAHSNATVEYSVAQAAEVSLEVYDLLGHKISSLVNQNQSSGKYRAELYTEVLSNGIYIVNLTVNGQSNIQKLIVQH